MTDAHPSPISEALRKAAEQFRFYEREHMAKANKATGLNNVGDANVAIAKAKTNREFAEMCEAALISRCGRDEAIAPCDVADLETIIRHVEETECFPVGGRDFDVLVTFIRYAIRSLVSDDKERGSPSEDAGPV